jgi:hypothetical protein
MGVLVLLDFNNNLPQGPQTLECVQADFRECETGKIILPWGSCLLRSSYYLALIAPFLRSQPKIALSCPLSRGGCRPWSPVWPQ